MDQKGNLRELGPPKKKSPFYQYFRKLVKQSLITGIPAIVTTKSIIGKVVKSIVFLICVAGFLYQTWEFLQMYFAYPTIVNVDIIKPEYIQLPAVSFCIFNRAKRSAICKVDPLACTDWKKMYPNKSHAEFAALYPLFDYGRRRTNYLIMHQVGSPFNPTWEYQDSTGYTLKDVMSNCEIRTATEKISCTENVIRFEALRPEYGDPNFCFAVESLRGKPKEVARNVSAITTLKLEIKTVPQEHPFHTDQPRVSIQLHDARSLGNPMAEGMMFDGGKKFTIYTDLVRKELMPAPYRSNCRNYTEEWIKNNGTGPLNQQMCIYKCRIDLSLEKGVCIHPTIHYPHRYASCQMSSNNPLNQGEMSRCYASCQEACEENTYRIRAECTGDALSSVEMFSYIGGYMGMWLGISLISLFDLLDTIAHLVCYPVTKRRKKKNLRKIADQHRSIPRPIYGPYDV